MSSREYAIGVTGIESDRPNAAAGQPHVFGINTFPPVSCVRRHPDAAVIFKRTGDKDLIGVVRIDEDGVVIAKQQTAAPPDPSIAIVTA